MSEYFIGLISGTSTDGVDAALVEFTPAAKLCHAHFLPYPGSLRDELLAFAASHYHGDAVDELGALDRRLGDLFARAAIELLAASRTTASQVRAIGSHGQTLRHRPHAEPPFTLQIADPNVIAARTGITTIADFRRRDLALGGEGAPLVPAFHAAAFSDPAETRAIVNIGGIANLTLLPAANGTPSGFDVGPGNVLMDSLSREQLKAPCDKDGAFAASGKASQPLLSELLGDAYFRQAPPKSTGPEYFNGSWLDPHVSNHPVPAADLMATLCELTACCIADAVDRCQPRIRRVLLCGGGVHNTWLRKRLAEHLPGRTLQSTADFGMDPDMVEAAAFAWLARETLAGRPGNLPAVTGARSAAVLGGIYLAQKSTPSGARGHFGSVE